jgi:hypothetical protein
MKLSVSRSPILVVLVIAGLAAGTALVAGYVDQPSQAQQVAAQAKCSDCARQGTETCCQVTGVCAEAQVHANATSQGPCAGCEQKAQAACCPALAGDSEAPGCCPAAAACPHAK